MEQTWRWFGPEDAITLDEIGQTGAEGIVTALHDISYGAVWTEEAIAARQALIARGPVPALRWSVVESLPVHEDIKRGAGRLDHLFGAYRTSLRNLARCGLSTVCYNFMPILDWTRTELQAPLPGGGTALRFNAHQIAAFDCFMLARPGAEAEYDPALLARARAWFDAAGEAERSTLLASIMAGLPGAYDRYDIPGLRRMLDSYAGIDHAALRGNLVRFLQEVVPAAEELGIRLCIHPDDPPRPIFGLARIVSTEADIAFILDALDRPANGLTLCTGSLGAGVGNDVAAIARRFADRIWFAHLRNVTKEPDGSFMESDHLAGDVPMLKVIRTLLGAEARRRAAGDQRWRIPMRADHGHELLGDAGRNTHPGYPLIGRLRGLAELRGAMLALTGEMAS
ncbi:mannonate dehydratase [Acidiphilium sp. AL]|uniref:Mannonate dehydratase n=2 Tax=Acidiphilium iwatense TaxID=768198 RepID=A0ABS9DUA6_9PROT|nr:mannonate dehydratase [Acidiphilium sp. AL]MCF3946284.1 mannonate dehydratase [Acidiphilium iwatense]MCU4158856.1 mannonate dehydratase [Acidiphilium sp. AL]